MSERFLVIQLFLVELAAFTGGRHVGDNGLAASTFTNDELVSERTAQPPDEDVIVYFSHYGLRFY